tara:strand:- start:835 stop:2133 length:1299 start_codon:yes stop_codon:yes gene_type:complete
MKIHIVGAGPTGLSLAWEIVRSTDHEVTVYERKTSCGGSWWEPDTEVRDIHAHRLLFDQFVNAHSFLKEMDLQWDELFQKTSSDFLKYTLKTFEPKDYVAVVELFFRVTFTPEKYKSISLHDYFENKLSDGGKKTIEHLPINIDGVTWKHMSTFEFIKTADQLLFSTPYTQKVSGKIMNDAIEEKLLNAGVNFIFGSELQNIEYRDDGYEASFSDGTVLSDDGMFFMCIDNSPALKLIGDNWGPLAEKKIRSATYGSICVLLDYDQFVPAGEELEILVGTRWNILVSNLPGTNTVSCVLCDLTKEILSSEPDVIKREVIHQLGFPPPADIRIGWGSEWTGEKWEFSQSSGVLGLNGQVPFFGKCPNVAMVGMMSYRDTAYSSIEAAVEVSRKLSHECFGTRRPIKKVTVSQVITITVVVLIVLILVYRNKNQ